MAAHLCPFHIHAVVVGGKHSAQSVGAQLAAQQVVLTKFVADRQRLAVAGISGHHYGRVGHFRGCEEQVRGDNVHILACEHELQALFIAVKQGDVVFTLQAFESLDDSLFHCTALGVEGQFHLVVFQHHFLFHALDGIVKWSGRVVGQLGSLIGFSCLLCCLLLFFGLLFSHIGYRVLQALLCQFFFRGLRIPAESNQENSDKHKTGNGIFVHDVVLFVTALAFFLFFTFDGGFHKIKEQWVRMQHRA